MGFTEYTNNMGSYNEIVHLSKQTDELMIANIIGVLNNPLISKLMDEDELTILCQVVKNHAVERAKFIMKHQKKNHQTSQRFGR